jgi:hypothetical protein
MSKPETVNHFVHFDLDVNFWAEQPPDAQTARPPRCLVCGAPGQQPDGRVVLHGHGVRVRRLRGPATADGEPAEIEIIVRRYACQRCGAVITVGPRGVLPRKRYTAMAIALALWLWSGCRQRDAQVRRATCPVAETGVSRPERWTTLRSWARTAREGRLWSTITAAGEATLRDAAMRVVRWLHSLGDPAAATDEQRIFGAAAHAR